VIVLLQLKKGGVAKAKAKESKGQITLLVGKLIGRQTLFLAKDGKDLLN